jgi:hypothetical protein
LSLKPLSEGRIALVPLDFRPPERHARKSTIGLSRHSASHTGDLLGLAGREIAEQLP